MAEAMNVEEQIRQNLKDAACPDESIDEILCFFTSNKKGDAQRLLAEHRKRLLDAVHTNQKRIDCLDYLLYQLSKGDLV